MSYAVFKCYGNDNDCITEIWSKFFKEFVSDPGYVETADTDYVIYFNTNLEGIRWKDRLQHYLC